MANTTPIKLFVDTAMALRAELHKVEASKGGIDKMLHGDGDSLNAVWGCSAVVLKSGEIQLVGAAAGKPVEITSDGTVTVKLLDGGTARGRQHKRDIAWFRANVEKIFLGALRLPEGDGDAARFKVDGVDKYIRVVPAATAPAELRS